MAVQAVLGAIVLITESAQQHSCSHNLLGVVQASMSNGLSTARLALAKGGEGNCRKEALARGVLYLFLTCGSFLHNVVTPLHNSQTGSMSIKPPKEVA